MRLLPLLSLLPGLLASSTPSSITGTPVPLEIHIMSQCPDALDCWDSLISPALDRLDQLSPTSSSTPHYTFQLSFIGRALSDGAILCKHGETECLGNMLHLCAAKLSEPPSPPPVKRYKGFSDCLLKNYEGIAEKKVVEKCVHANQQDDMGEDMGDDKEGKWGFQELNNCVSDYSGEDGGPELLRRSVERTRKAGVTKSCTVRVNGKVWCVRDGGEWVDCPTEGSVDALVGEVERLWHGEPEVGRGFEDL